ncbi:MAG TPA: beta-propeller domain-containing protein [Polyangia bacterium]|nr:beta-propeller domain-containing protein [Polyangia bacterium]
MTRLAYVLGFATAVAACSSNPNDRIVGQTDFVSAPMAGTSSGGGATAGDANGAGGGGAGGTPAQNPGSNTTVNRTVEETDLYRLEGTRLYYLNGYRGLMVFDVSDVDHPKLLGRSAIYGSPVEMLVRNGIAVIVVADWYGQMDDGTPFHGSIVRGLDATDPTNIKVLGEAKLGGWVRDTRVVGDVLYAVSEDYNWVYGWGVDAVTSGGAGASTGTVSPGSTTTTETVVVSSVSFANNVISAVGKVAFPGYSGIFNVTPQSILLAHDPGTQSAQTELLYLDISDPAGSIVQRGKITVDGRAQGWGADNGRWNLDFADGKTAHVIGCAGGQYGCDGSGYILDIVDFTNPDAPALASKLAIPSTGWSVAARFDTNRLYLSPDNYSYGDGSGTPLQVYDTTDPTAPKLAGATTIPGSVWNILPAPMSRLFALGADTSSTTTGEAVSLKYLDVTNPNAPALLGTSTFGSGWAWTPAAGTFKAFTMDATQGLVVLPFSGWSYDAQSYNNGLQLIEFTPTSERTAGAAKTKGWVERGIFVGSGATSRLVSLSDLALSVVDYSNHDAPTVTASLTLARNVIAAQPGGATIAEISSDWWDNDVTASEVRVLPVANAEESTDAGAIPSLNVEGTNARVFRNGDLAYVVTNVRLDTPCPGAPSGSGCYQRAEQISVVDLSNGNAVQRGTVRLPNDPWGYYWWGWYGFWWWDWYDGAEAVQVNDDALAFRRWEPVYDGNGRYVDSNSYLYVVDLANPDSPSVASTLITDDPDAWWGNMRVVGSTLYTTHYEWLYHPTNGPFNQWTVKYYADRIDLSDRSHPRIEAKINVPGLVVGGSDSDPSLLYTIDYRWDGDVAKNDFDVLRVHGNNKAELLSKTTIDGWVGSTFVRGDRAYMSAEEYTANGYGYDSTHVKLHALDLTDPRSPVDRASTAQAGWGWLLDVQGDRAIVSSGWGPNGVDIYQLADGAAPQFRQFARTRGWWTNAISRQDSALFLSSGYWGVERIDLQ